MNVSLASLWMPIVLSAVFVFIASSIVHMMLPLHRNDYKRLGDKEPQVIAAFKSWALAPGMYMFPACDPKTIKNDPGAMERFNSGPWGVFTIIGAKWNMGKLLGLWFLNTLIMSFVVAYVAAASLHAGEQYLKVFQVVGATALLAYGGSVMTDSIWKGKPWSQLPVFLFDAIVYALLTAGTFGWLWPKAQIVTPLTGG